MTSGPTDAGRALADVALGSEPADVIVKGGRMVEVHTGAVVEADIAQGKRIAPVGHVARRAGAGTQVYDAAGALKEMLDPRVARDRAGLADPEARTTPRRVFLLPFISTQGKT